MRRVGDDELAVGVPDVVRELRAAPGRVDADDRRAGERGTAEQEDVLGHVVEQHADVERVVAPARRLQHRRPHRTLVRDLGPRPRPILEDQPGARVVGARGDELGDRRHAHGSLRVGEDPRSCSVRGMALVHPDWVRRLNLFGDVVGDPRLLVSLDPDELLASARASTGLDDLGEADWPGWTETYRRMVDGDRRRSAAARARSGRHPRRGA